jgi:hypothetical protein
MLTKENCPHIRPGNRPSAVAVTFRCGNQGCGSTDVRRNPMDLGDTRQSGVGDLAEMSARSPTDGLAIHKHLFVPVTQGGAIPLDLTL